MKRKSVAQHNRSSWVRTHALLLYFILAFPPPLAEIWICSTRAQSSKNNDTVRRYKVNSIITLCITSQNKCIVYFLNVLSVICGKTVEYFVMITDVMTVSVRDIVWFKTLWSIRLIIERHIQTVIFKISVFILTVLMLENYYCC